MWAKVLGLLCAGVFVGATIVEIKQMRRRKRAIDVDVTEEDESQDGDVSGETAPCEGQS